MGDHWEKDVAAAGEPLLFAGGAALVDRESGSGWVLIDDGEVARFGPAMALASRRGFASLDVLVEESVPGVPVVPGVAGIVARRASQFVAAPAVWSVAGRELRAAVVAGVPLDGEPPVDPDLAELFSRHGAEPVVEHGVVRGEVLGLEVARVIGDRLVVGVGRHDRDARSEMRSGQDVASALEEAVAAVRVRRRPGAACHPANTLARGRWLRSIVCARPELAGALSLSPVSPPLPWFDLPEAGSAPCVGADAAGAPIVVVCSTGGDLDLVPTAADCRLLYSPAARLVLVVPEGDDHPVTRSLAAALASPADIRVVPRDWEGLG